MSDRPAGPTGPDDAPPPPEAPAPAGWPSADDFTAAVRHPALAFADPDLRSAEPVVAPDGSPLARPGDSADVYQLCADDGRSWAVKCFRRPVPGLGRRYAAVAAALARADLPFAVGCGFLEDGVRVGDAWHPAVKMDWVEGRPLDRAVRDNLDTPAALDDFLQTWARVAGRLREAGVAHADLQPRNVLVVPDRRPGAHQLKLVDYDGLFVPALAGDPADEFGHPNYQHPARAAGRVYSADVDRFPLLVVGTALAALAAGGPDLWRRYDTGDNLLFRADDFRDPAGSPLLTELAKADHPLVRTLAGHLARACTRPVPETPWLDEVLDAPAPPPARRVAAAVGADQLPRASKSSPGAVDLSGFESRPARGRPAAAPEDAEPAPSNSGWVLAAVATGFLLVLGAGCAGVVTGLFDAPPAVVQAPPDDASPSSPTTPKADQPGFRPNPAAAEELPADHGVVIRPDTPAPPPGQGVAIRPDPPAPPIPPVGPRVFIRPGLPDPPPVAEPAGPGFRLAWSRPLDAQPGFARPHFPRAGKLVFVASSRRIDSFDAKTGQPGPTLRGPDVPRSPPAVWLLDDGRIAAAGSPRSAPGLWDAKTGEPLPDLVRDDLLPPPPAQGVRTNAQCQMSADGRYVFVGYLGAFTGQAYGRAPYRVIDTVAGKVVHDGEWQAGAARFTADGSRLLICETNGRIRWVKLPAGEVEVQWEFQPNSSPGTVSGMSADGSLVVYHGRPPGMPLNNYLLDGRTGQVLRAITPWSGSDRGTLTADGRWLVGLVTEFMGGQPTIAATVADARTGAVLTRTPLEAGLNDFLSAAFTPDGKAFAVAHRTKRELSVYELRGDVPAPPADAVVPPPVGPVPPRVPPGSWPKEPPPPPPPLPVAAAGMAMPPAPPLKPRWGATADAALLFNGVTLPPVFSRDGRTLIVPGGPAGTVLTFDAKTGAAGPAYDGGNAVGGVLGVAPFGTDRVAFSHLAGIDGRATIWDTKTGRRAEDLPFPEMPPPGPMGHTALLTVSPGGRYTVTARRELGRQPMPGPLRVLDTTTNKVVVSADWNGGHVAFTADEGRVFVYDGQGKATWYKLPSGEVDAEWRAANGVGRQFEFVRLLGMTADGKTLLLYGPTPNGGSGVHLVDGRTGQPVRSLNVASYQPMFSALSPDGRYLAIPLMDFRGGAGVGGGWHIDVFDTTTWRIVGRVAPPEGGPRQPPQMGFSPDGKELAVAYPGTRDIKVYPTSGEDGPPQVAIVPAPVRPAPPVVRPAPAGDAPELVAKWNRPAGVGRDAGPDLYVPDARTVVLRDTARESLALFEERTGTPAPGRVEGLQWAGAGEVFPLPRGRVGFHYRTDATVSVWDLKAGKAADPIPIPPVPAGPDRQNHLYVRASEDGRFLFAARLGTKRAAAPVRVFEVSTGKAVVSAEWGGGAARFTADGDRVLVAEAAGRCRRFTLPAGQPDGEWNLPDPGPGGTAKITDLSEDGRLVGYAGSAGGPNPAAVLDAKTGRVVRAFGADEYLVPSPVALSADGRRAAAVRKPDGGRLVVDVVDVATGRLVGRATAPAVWGVGGAAPALLLSPDGRGLVVHNFGLDRVSWYDVPADPAGAPPQVEPGPLPDPGPRRGPVGLAPGELAPRWAVAADTGSSIADVRYDSDARLVLLSNLHLGRHVATDVGTGEPAPGRVVGLGRVPGGRLVPLAGSRVGVVGPKENAVAVWDLKAAKPGEPIPIPDVPPGPDATAVRHTQVSPDGKFVVVGYRRAWGPGASYPFRVFEAGTGRAAVSAEWGGGTAHFTADGGRVLVAELGGRCRWFTLPAGQPDGEWSAGEDRLRHFQVTGLSADGRVVGCVGGRPAGPDPAAPALLDGASGRVLRVFGPDYFYTSPVQVSADGRRAAVMRKPAAVGSDFTIDVIDADGGTVVGRATVTTVLRSVPTFQLTPDGRALLVHDYAGGKLYWYDVPDKVPAVGS